jgi:hypothetical protein
MAIHINANPLATGNDELERDAPKGVAVSV